MQNAFSLYFHSKMSKLSQKRARDYICFFLFFDSAINVLQNIYSILFDKVVSRLNDVLNMKNGSILGIISRPNCKLITNRSKMTEVLKEQYPLQQYRVVKQRLHKAEFFVSAMIFMFVKRTVVLRL